MARHIRWPLLAAILLGLIGCDAGTKSLASATLRGAPPIPLAAGIVDLRYVENHDAAFDVFRRVGLPATPLVLATGALIVLALALGLWWQRRRRSLWEQLPLALVTAGAVGNIADRIRLGYVVDFIHVHHWPVFNVADIAVVVGALLLAFQGMREPKLSAPPGSC